jgi:holo-[acyl-carrier protein] synthase
MVKGIGTDIIEIERIDRIIQRWGSKFLDKLFTYDEQQYCLGHQKSARNFAARFAAKEAVAKAFGTGIQDGISWLDIEIAHAESGKPIVNLSKRVQVMFNNPEIIISISHSQNYATAVAVLL